MRQDDNMCFIILPNGRRLAYALYGVKNGPPVIYHHGWPSSRLEGGFLAQVATKARVCLIAPDRPGLGRSDSYPHRTLLDWPDDIIGLANALDLNKFAVIGVSGGGPYVAACAYKIPHRLSGATIVAGISPMKDPQTQVGMRLINRIFFAAARWTPWLLNIMMSWTREATKSPDMMKRTMRDLPMVDQKTLQGKESMLQSILQETFRQGVKSVTQEARIYTQPWGFDLQEITIPVSIWQGELDVNVPPSNGRILATHIPQATASFRAGEGHFSLLAHHGEAILIDLLNQ